jgi:hypothetical protein
VLTYKKWSRCCQRENTNSLLTEQRCKEGERKRERERDKERCKTGKISERRVSFIGYETDKAMKK